MLVDAALWFMAVCVVGFLGFGCVYTAPAKSRPQVRK
jgi:hypothetical protein